MKKTILVTGANGFIAKNLLCHLNYNDSFEYNILRVNRDTKSEDLHKAIVLSDVIIHLAGENRPKDSSGFIKGNVSYTQQICALSTSKKIPIIYTSSSQAELDNKYGQSKLAAENLLKKYSESTGARVAISRLPNVFGKWCKPNYNSFVATMCYNLWRDIPIEIDDLTKMINLVYVDDVVNTLIKKTTEMLDNIISSKDYYFAVERQYNESLGGIYNKLEAIKNGQKTLQITQRAKSFDRALSATFMSYCPKEKIKYPLVEHKDNRGSFYEIFKLGNYGQLSISTTKPGVVRGNHFHHSKQEKFLVVSGECHFKFRSLNTGEVISLKTSDKTKEVVEVPLGYTHNFTNIGSNELVVLIWCNEEFDKDNPDTYFLEV